jgi:hypothetical protein
MNDTELDEMLDCWNVPPVPTSLRDSVRAAFAASPPQTAPPRPPVRGSWAFASGARKALPAAAMIGIGAFLWVVTQALSQTPPPVHIPYTVDSEYIRYGDDGSPVIEMLSTSYTGSNGGEILISRSIPGHLLGTAAARTLAARTLDAVLPAWQRMILPFVVAPKDIERFKEMRQSGVQTVGVISGCADWTCLVINHWGFRKPAAGTSTACVEGTVLGSETILNHPTTAIQRSLGPQGRITMWMAPDLGCFALRITSETMRPDGSFHIWQTKQATKVTMNP